MAQLRRTSWRVCAQRRRRRLGAALGGWEHAVRQMARLRLVRGAAADRMRWRVLQWTVGGWRGAARSRRRKRLAAGRCVAWRSRRALSGWWRAHFILQVGCALALAAVPLLRGCGCVRQ